MNGSAPFARSICLAIILSCAACVAFGLDYRVKPLPPELDRDEATTFLVDLSDPKDAPDFAAGDARMELDITNFGEDGCYRGPIEIPMAGNFDPSRWTVEMVIRLPAETAERGEDVSLGGWQAGATRLDFGLSRGVGATFRMFGRHDTDGRKYEFNFGANAGGGGATIHRDAPGEWVYIAFGFDIDERGGGAIVRNMDGDVLLRSMQYASEGSLNAGFLNNVPENERAAARNQSWRDMAESLARFEPTTITLGVDSVDLRAIRISGEYLPEIVQPQPLIELSGMKVWRGEDVDPERAETSIFDRIIGYPGSRSQRAIEIEEPFVSVSPGSRSIELLIEDLPIGIYALHIYGTIDPAGRDDMPRVWKPCPMEFEATDARGERIGWGRMLLKQSFSPRLMQGFHFQVNEPGDFTATLSIPESAMETPRIREIVLVDKLAGLSDEVIKREQRLEQGRADQPDALTQERMERDDRIWNAFIPLNIHTYAGLRNFDQHTDKFDLPNWELVNSGRSIDNIFAPLDIVNRDTGEVLSHEDVIRGEPLPGEPTDDGTGIFFSKEDYPELPHDIYLAPRARMLTQRGMRFFGVPKDEGSGNMGQRAFARRYMEQGDIEAGHDAAMVLTRIAYDYPAIDYGLQDIRLCTQHPDLEYNQDWSYGRGGKLINWSWSADDVRGLLIAYDQVFPYIKDNQVFADAVNRFIPWVETPEDVMLLIEQRLIFTAVREVEETRFANNRRIHDVAGEVLGPHPRTIHLFDLTTRYAAIHPFTGTYQELYGAALNQLGHYHIGSTGYAFGSASSLLEMAMSMKRASDEGLDVKMPLGDVKKYPKVRGAADFLIDQFIAGGFWITVGTASGGTHAGPDQWSRRLARGLSENAVELLGDPRHAWLLVNHHGVDDEDLIALSEGVEHPVLHNPSRYLPHWGGIVEMGVDETDIRNKTAAFLVTSHGRGHAHNDHLDLNLYALGLPVSVDLAQRSEGRHWSRPNAGWSFLHNHAIAHDGDHTEDPRNAGNQSGEPWLRAFAPPLMRGSYVDISGEERLDRDVIMMQVGDENTYYVFDLQRLSGRNYHTWCFHGVESHDLDMNIPMREEVVRWTDRMLPEKGDRELPLSQRLGTATDNLQAVWTATREPREYEHQFSGGGTVRTVALEQTVLGDLYDPALPPARIRATLLGHGGATVMSAMPFSQPYNYAFPFLWVQHPAGDEPSIYPAIYEWYRGDETVIADARLVQRDPIVVEVTTTTGQVDTYRLEGRAFSAVSRDGDGVRWAQLSGGHRLEADGLIIAAEDRQVGYATSIESIDYAESKFKTANPLPSLTGALIRNDGRSAWQKISGVGTDFSWRYDFLAHEGRITDLKVIDNDHIELRTNQPVFYAGHGNRGIEGFVVTNEDHTWHFRHTGDGDRYRVIHRPGDEMLSKDVFTDANGDGFIHAKTYEIGIGDNVELMSNLIVKRTADGYRIETNVPCVVTLPGVGELRLDVGTHDIER